jgi:hypothetical protein
VPPRATSDSTSSSRLVSSLIQLANFSAMVTVRHQSCCQERRRVQIRLLAYRYCQIYAKSLAYKKELLSLSWSIKVLRQHSSILPIRFKYNGQLHTLPLTLRNVLVTFHPSPRYHYNFKASSQSRNVNRKDPPQVV